MRWGRGGVAGALFLTLMLAVTGAARAADHPSNEVDNQLEMKARESFAAGRYDDAIESFAKLYAKSLNPVYLRNIGRCFQQKHQPQDAIDKFRDYLAKTKTGKNKISADERAEIEGYIKEMEAMRDEQARAAVPLPPPPASAPVTPLPSPAPGAPAPALPPPTAATATLTATAPPPAAEESHSVFTRWWFWTIVGVVAVGATVGIVLATGGSTKPSCPTGVTCE